ncbi:3-keto-5-aminohexanoate cleavage protein [Paraburkholderia sp. EG287A]|uniref:3-keto-5-aminohexanoate cleavage protein n=1 Tax=unclassified Paraburkholderia TaxID=2615204 RepID=UPI0034D1D215
MSDKPTHSGPTIITAAVTGSIHTPSLSPYLPYKVEDIAAHAIQAAEAGAAIIHLHVRDPLNGQPSSSPDLFRSVVEQIASATDAVINVTTGGSSSMSIDERLAAPLQLNPEMCSLNMGSMNFGMFPLAERRNEWQFDWEKPFLEASRQTIFKNTFADIEEILSVIGTQRGARFELECYDVGHIQTVAHYRSRGLLTGPIFLQFVLGILGGIDAAPEQLLHLKHTADRLLGRDYEFSVLAGGRHQIPLGTMGVLLGGNVRVGLEDSLTIGRGKLAQSSAEQVSKIRRIIEELGKEIATPDQVRARLELKGRSHVNF